MTIETSEAIVWTVRTPPVRADELVIRVWKRLDRCSVSAVQTDGDRSPAHGVPSLASRGLGLWWILSGRARHTLRW